MPDLRQLRFFALLLLLACGVTTARAQVSILMQHNDLARTGANLNETILNTTNVNPNTFGKLFARQVDGQIYAQPLIVANKNIGGKTRNVVYVVTMHGSAYCFDADDPAASAPLWQRSFIDPANGITTVPWNEVTWAKDIEPEIGILSTPAIDTASNTIYLVAKTRKQVGQTVTYEQNLYALDMTTGANKFGGPKLLEAEVPGTGDGSYRNAQNVWMVPYYNQRQNQRSALTLHNGILYVTSASHGDVGPYHGWILGYNAQTLQLVKKYCSTRNGGLGGFWMSGQGVAIDDSGNLYAITGNGSFSEVVVNNVRTVENAGDSFLKINPNATDANGMMQVTDYFTPYNQQYLQDVDADLGVGGILLLPGTDLLVGGSKEGRLYVMNRSNMGKYNPTVNAVNDDSQIKQWWWAFDGHLHSAPIYWNGPAGPTIYLWSENDEGKAYRFNTSTQLFATTPALVTAERVPDGMPGSMLSISANGAQSGTGILWAQHPYSGNANQQIRPGILRAYNAETLTELWDSYQNVDRDDYGNFAKYCAPTVANGKVYMATFSNQLVVYGLGQWVAKPTITPASGEYNSSVNISMSVATAGATIRYTLDGSDPTATSPIYTAPFTRNVSTIVKAKAFKAGLSDSPIARATYLIGATTGIGDGLKGTYYDDLDFGGISRTRVDPVVNFDTGENPPIPGIEGTNWSARWTGFVQPRITGTHTFYTMSDDGVRLWVNDQLLIDNWTYHGTTENTGTINLTAGVKYKIKLEFFQGFGGAVIQLLWSNAFTDRQLIPKSQLYSGANFVANPIITPGSANFTNSLKVHMDDATPGAVIRYTLDGSEPTETSLLYTGPFPIVDTTTVRARAFKSGMDASDVIDVKYNEFTPGNGQGILGDYFNDNGNGNYFTTHALQRVDATLDFDWAGNAPSPLVKADDFSVRWSGQLFAPVTGNYTFTTISDDGVRFWIGDLIGNPDINNWTDHGPTRDSYSVSLTAGQRYNVGMEFYERGGGAVARLLWTYPGQPEQAVPNNRLFAYPRTAAGSVTLESSVNAVQPITFEFRPTDGSPPYIITLNLAALAEQPTGTFNIFNLPCKNYTVHIKGGKWLAKNIAVNALNGNALNLTLTLKAGDANDDNVIDVLDLDTLIRAFDSTSADPNWNDQADFNCDGSVDVLDLDILIRNFDLSGDP